MPTTSWRLCPGHISGKIFSLQTHADLLKFGFLPNESKCVWDPVQEITWLGVSINTSEATLRLTAKRVDSILTDIDNNILAHKNKQQHVKTFASICGKIISCGNCVGNLTKLMTRRLYLTNRKRVACVYSVIMHAGNVRRIREKPVKHEA